MNIKVQIPAIRTYSTPFRKKEVTEKPVPVQTQQGDTFEESLRNREFEPDGPNYTPRISGVLHIEGGYTYEMSILKSNNGDPDQCLRFTFGYDNPLHFSRAFKNTLGISPSEYRKEYRIFTDQ